MTNSLLPAAPQSAAERERDAVIAECIDLVATTLPAHDVHSCCRVHRQRLVAALEALRGLRSASRPTHHGQT